MEVKENRKTRKNAHGLAAGAVVYLPWELDRKEEEDNKENKNEGNTSNKDSNISVKSALEPTKHHRLFCQTRNFFRAIFKCF